ncbi:MAG: ABC transporter ATP-binding protein [Bacteroidota bacterium]
MDKILEVKNLHINFQTGEERVKAVKGIDFTLHRGETLGIVGESGSGKSVTSLSIMGLVPAPPGQVAADFIHFHENAETPIDLLQCTEADLQAYRGSRLAMIFQEPMRSLNPVFRCGEQVMEAILLHQKIDKSAARQQVLQLFEQVKLPQPDRIFNAYPHQLSGGQKQRVMIAMAMSCQPDILIADEPTTALDVTVQKTILDLMSDLKQELNAGLIFISHDLGVIAEVADRVLVMYQGQIVEEGAVETIFKQPKHPYTQGLVACRPPLQERLHRLPVIEDFVAADTSEPFHPIRIDRVAFAKRQEQLQAQAPILKVEELKTWFPSKRNWWGKPMDYVKAVNGVSFEVYPGETLGLVGESGCGKTTLGRSILNLAPIRSGKVEFMGQSILDLSNREMRQVRKDMQIIFQDPYSSLNPRLTVGQAILEPMKIHGIGRDKAERLEKVYALLRQVQLEEKHFHRYPHEFSGGQRQRVCIARALAVEPKFIVCDESVSALDVSIQAQILNLLKDLQDEFGLTYIFISHDLSVVKFMSDRMMVMQSGQIVEMGDAEAIYEAPQSLYTKKLIEAIPQGL